MQAAHASDNRARVLVVDDDADMLRLLSMRLNSAGYRVSTAASAESALAQLQVERPQLVLSDVRLPGQDGLALFKEIRARHPSLPVILLTAHGTIPDAVEATAHGVFSYLTKPYDAKVLLDKIAQALALGAAPSEPTQTDATWRSRHHQPLGVHGRPARRGSHGRCVGCERAVARGQRRRQGNAGASHPPGQRACPKAVHRGQLRRDPRGAARVGVVRPRERRVHGCGDQPQGPVPGCGRRHAAARRDRRHAAGAAGQAAARLAGARDPPGRLQPVASRSTCASSRPRTATWRPRWAKASSARTCTTG